MTESCRTCRHARWFDQGGECADPAVHPLALGLPLATTFLARLNARTSLSYGAPHTGCPSWEGSGWDTGGADHAYSLAPAPSF